MSGEPHLRPVPPGDEEADAVGAPPQKASRLTLALTIALAIALALLAWNRTQLAQQVHVLEGTVRTLESEITERDRVIAAHRGRLNEVRVRIDALGELLERPLPEAD